MVSIFNDNDTEIVNKTSTMEKPTFFDSMKFEEKVVYSKGMDMLETWEDKNLSVIDKMLDLTFTYSSPKKIEEVEKYNYEFKYYKNTVQNLLDENELTVKIYNMLKFMDQIKNKPFTIINNLKIDWETVIFEEILKNKLKQENLNQEELLKKVEEHKENINSTYNYKNKKLNISDAIKSVVVSTLPLLTVDNKALPNLPFLNEIKNSDVNLYCVELKEKPNEISYTVCPFPFLDEIKTVFDENNNNNMWWSNFRKYTILILLSTAPLLWNYQKMKC